MAAALFESPLGDLSFVDPVPGDMRQDSVGAAGHAGRAVRAGQRLAAATPVYLARHGETESNRLSRYAGHGAEALTDLGRAQTRTLAGQLGVAGIQEIWTSEVARAQESGALLGRALGIPVRVDRRLSELRMGPWEGLTEQAVAERFPDAYAVWCAVPDQLALPGRETLDALAIRVTAAVKDAARQSRPILLMTHVAPVRVAVLRTLGLPLQLYKRLHVANADCVHVDLAQREVRRLGEGRSLRQQLDPSLDDSKSSVA